MLLAVPAAVIVVLVGTAAVVVAPAGHAIVLCSASSATAPLQHAGGKRTERRGMDRRRPAAARRELGQHRSDDEVSDSQSLACKVRALPYYYLN